MKLMMACAAVTIMVSPPALAGSSSGGNVTEVVANPSSGALNFAQNGTRVSAPSCASGNPSRWALDTSTAAGQAVAATILTAFSLGKNINVQGTGACPAAQSNVEGVSYVVVN